MSDKTWFEAAEETGWDVEVEDYPMYTVTMALAEQQKRTADALEAIYSVLPGLILSLNAREKEG